jgi:hypothetical protein
MPVNTIEGPTTAQAAVALQLLRTVHREVLSLGWHWNTEYGVSLEVDINTGKIPVPSSILRFQVEDSPWVIQRGPFLYNRADRTDIFDAAVVGSCIRYLPWDEISEEAKTYITALAKVRYYQGFVGVDPGLDLLQREAIIAHVALNEADTDVGNYSIFDSPDIAQGLPLGHIYVTGAPRMGRGIMDDRTPKR